MKSLEAKATAAVAARTSQRARIDAAAMALDDPSSRAARRDLIAAGRHAFAMPKDEEGLPVPFCPIIERAPRVLARRGSRAPA